MADIKLADGRKVKEIRTFRDGRWYKNKGYIFHNGKWIEFSRPETQFLDDTVKTLNSKILNNTFSIEDDKYLIKNRISSKITGSIEKTIVEEGILFNYEADASQNINQWDDSSFNKKHGKLMNINGTWESGWREKGLKLDGEDDYIIPNVEKIKTFEIVFGYEKNNQNRYPTLLNQNPQSSNGKFIWLYAQETHLDLQIGNNGYTRQRISNILDYQNYNHLVFVFDTSVKVYKNSLLFGEYSFPNLGHTPDSGEINIGTYQRNHSYTINAHILEIRGYDRHLSEEEVKNNYLVVKEGVIK